MRIGNYQLRPGLLPTILVMIGLAVLIRLGFWQLSRADEKRAILAKQQATLALPPKQLDVHYTDSENLAFRRLSVTGSFLPKYQIFIDNKTHEGVAGYDVVTPLQIKNSNKYVLVDRGWVPLVGASRASLPSIDTPDQAVTLLGLAKYHPQDVVSLGEGNRTNQGWPALVRWIDIPALHSETKLNLLPFLFLLDPGSPHGFVRKWIFVNMPPEKHVSYAVQWFGMALVLLIIYLVTNTKRITTNEIHHD